MEQEEKDAINDKENEENEGNKENEENDQQERRLRRQTRKKMSDEEVLFRWRIALLCLLVLMLAVAACNSKKQEAPLLEEASEPEQPKKEEQDKEEQKKKEIQPQKTIDISEPEEVEEIREGEVRSNLTGMWISEEYEGRRPYAVMINNIKQAYPQSGLGEAGIIYEALAEGGITRLMGIFDYFNGERLGSVRSARHYYVTLAEEYDAIFIHFGQTKYAQSRLDALGTDNLNGLLGEGNTVFYRDNSIAAPHNAFASGKGIEQAIENKGYRTMLREGAEPHFHISTDAEVVLTGVSSISGKQITLPFSTYGSPYLSYDEKTKLYHRYAYGSEHVDSVTNEPLTFTTILVQFVKEYDIDKNGYQTMELDNSSGSGYYLTGGKTVSVYWSKGSASSITRYYYDEARTQEIVLNPGRIYVAVFPSYQAGAIVIE